MIWVKIKYRLAFYYRTVLFTLGLGNKLLRDRAGQRIVVFHGVDKVGNTKLNSRFVSRPYFEEFIQYVAANYNVVSVDQMYEGKLNKNAFNISITFDDGYLNNYLYAIPILEKYNVPASFYISSIHDQSAFLWPDFVDLVTCYTRKKEIKFGDRTYVKSSKGEFQSGNLTLKNRCKELSHAQIKELYKIFSEEWSEIQKHELDDYWKLMDKQQIKRINGNHLFTVGCHGKTHTNLAMLDLEEAKSEIRESKRWLEEASHSIIDEFAFPFGEYTQDLIEYCADLGFSKMLLVDYKQTADAANVKLEPRMAINPHLSLKHQIACILKGRYY